MTVFKWTALILFFMGMHCNAQIYHYKTGKVVPSAKTDTVYWTKGIFNHYYADFGTLVVKENRNERDSKLLNIPVVRVAAYSLDSISYPIFVLNGGPGETNINSELINNNLLEHHDFVFVGYRGVDGSPNLSSSDLSHKIFSQSGANKVEQIMDSMLFYYRANGIDYEGYSLQEVIYDIKAVKEVLKYDTISFIAFSYGTMLAQLYDQIFQKEVIRMVQIGARPLGDFCFDENYFNSQMNLIYNYYFKDSDITGGHSLIDLLTSVSIEEKYLNGLISKEKILLFAFSQLYSSFNIERTFRLFQNAKNDGGEGLLHEVDKFFKNYPGELVLGDLYLKKQGWLDKTNNELNKKSNIIETVNHYYNPNNKILSLNKNFEFKLSKCKVLFISGDIDIAAPPALIQSEIIKYYSNSEHFINKKCGHLNLVIDKKNEINALVFNFLSP